MTNLSLVERIEDLKLRCVTDSITLKQCNEILADVRELERRSELYLAIRDLNGPFCRDEDWRQLGQMYADEFDATIRAALAKPKDSHEH